MTIPRVPLVARYDGCHPCCLGCRTLEGLEIGHRSVHRGLCQRDPTRTRLGENVAVEGSIARRTSRESTEHGSENGGAYRQYAARPACICLPRPTCANHARRVAACSPTPMHRLEDFSTTQAAVSASAKPHREEITEVSCSPVQSCGVARGTPDGALPVSWRMPISPRAARAAPLSSTLIGCPTCLASRSRLARSPVLAHQESSGERLRG